MLNDLLKKDDERYEYQNMMKQIKPVKIQARRLSTEFDEDDLKKHLSLIAPTKFNFLGEVRMYMIE